LKTQFNTTLMNIKMFCYQSEFLQPFQPVKAEIHTNVRAIRHRNSPT
jgi:hypothetical protein